jgi:arylsulfatase A-like enzyme
MPRYFNILNQAWTNMTRRQWLHATAGGLSIASAQPGPKSNLVIIVADDLGIGDLGCYGAAEARIPHLDRIAADGIRFTDWHANSPVCSPSRASLLTGRYPQRCGIPQILFSRPDFNVPGLRAGEWTLGGELKKRGYRTAAIGKWHLGTTPESRPVRQGFDSFFGFYSGWIDYYSHRYYTLGGQPVFHDLWRNDTEVWQEPEYQTEMFGREAKSFIEAQTSSQPFFLYLAFGAPHYPMMAPQKYLDRFPASMDRDRRLHLATVAALDDAVGEVRSALQRAGFDKNTCVFFMSDNGATHEVRADHRGRPYEGGSNRPFRGWKGSLFEGGMRVPALLTWPGAARPGTVDEPLAAIDLAPTFLQSTHATADGADLSGLLRSRSALPERTLFWEYDGQVAARSGAWKLLTSHREFLGGPLTESDWLSDLRKDPTETRNVAAEHPEVVAMLKRGIAEWKQKNAESLKAGAAR